MEFKPVYENTPQQQQQQQQQQEEEEGDHEKLEKHQQKQQQQEEGDQEKLEKQQQQQQQKQKQKHVFHVLAVDDSLIDRKLLEKLLRVSSYKVTCVDSGDKALEYLGLIDNVENNSTASASASAFPSCCSSQQEGLRVNLIMTDFCMPGMSGYDLLKKLKGSSWKDVPVVIMSSENVPARISMCLEGGAEEFLLKPLQLSDLDKLETHLLKSLNQNMDNNEFSGGNNESNGSGNNNSNNEINNYKSNNGAFIKRKALTVETQERRPKMKGLAVV